MQEGEAKKTFGEKLKALNKKQLAAIYGLGGVVIVLIIVFLGICLKVSAYDKIYPNVIVGGIDIGGTTIEEAKNKLNDEYGLTEWEKEITLKLEEKEVKFNTRDIEAVVDFDKTVQNAYDYGCKGSILKRIGVYFSNEPYEVPFEASINIEKAEGFIAQLAEDKEIPVKETSYSVLGDILTITNGHGGIRVNREKAYDLIKKAIFSEKTETIELSLEKAEPENVDIDEFYKKITEGQKNAAFIREEDGNIAVAEGFPKVEMEKSDLKAALESGKESYDIKVKATPPEITAEKLRPLLFRDEMGSWTSKYSESNVGRSQNVKLSASRINGVTLLPGESFSYDKTIGSRTASNGYKVAAVYVGNKVDQGIGGGICQTSSTLYSAVLYANLEIVSRTSHSLPVSYMPAGQDATIAEGYIDFIFKNNTDYPIKIVCTAGSGAVKCSILGVKPEGESVNIVNTVTSTLKPKITRTTNPAIPVGYKKIAQKGVDGYTVASQRIVSVNGVEKKNEKLTKSVYKAQDIIEEVNPADENTPSENLRIFDENTVVETVSPVVIPPEVVEELTENNGKEEPIIPEENKETEEANPNQPEAPETGNETVEKETPPAEQESNQDVTVIEIPAE